jgi:hypothetical protein
MADDNPQTFEERAGEEFNLPPAVDLDVWKALEQAPPSLRAAPQTQPTQAFGDREYLKEMIEQSREEGRLAGKALEQEGEATKGMVGELTGLAKDIRNTPIPQQQRLPRQPAPPSGQDAMGWVQAAALMGAMGGFFARGNATVALNAFAAANQGFNAGQQQQYKNAIADWKMATERLQADNDARLDQYKMILSNKKMSADAMASAYKIVAAQYQDQMNFHLAEQKNLPAMAALLQRSDEQAEIFGRRTALMDQQIRKNSILNDFYEEFGPNVRSPEAMAMISKWKRQKDQGDPASPEEMQSDIAKFRSTLSEARSVGNYTAKVETASRDAQRISTLVLAASEKVPRGDLVAFNNLAQAAAYQGSDPALIELRTQLNALRSVYVRVMNPTNNATEGPRVETHLNGLFEAGLGQGGLQAQIHAIMLEIESQRRATRDMKESLGADAPIPTGESLFEKALRDAGAPNRLPQGGGPAQVGGSNVDPYSGWGNPVQH